MGSTNIFQNQSNSLRWHSIQLTADCDHIVNEFLFECNNQNKNKINIFIYTVDVDKATSVQVNYIRNAIQINDMLVNFSEDQTMITKKIHSVVDIDAGMRLCIWISKSKPKSKVLFTVLMRNEENNKLKNS